MNNMPPNMDSFSFTGSAVLVGYLLIGDLTNNEQDAIGNWLTLVGQILQTNSSQSQVLEDRRQTLKNGESSNDIELLKKSINCICKEIDKLKGKN